MICSRKSPHGSTLDVVLKRGALARIGSKRTAHLWHTARAKRIGYPPPGRISTTECSRPDSNRFGIRNGQFGNGYRNTANTFGVPAHFVPECFGFVGYLRGDLHNGPTSSLRQLHYAVAKLFKGLARSLRKGDLVLVCQDARSLLGRQLSIRGCPDQIRSV
jgi:hypothetical protein